MSRLIRFRPPEVHRSPELEWVLLRAFAPLTAQVPDADLPAAVALATRLDLDARIGARARQVPELQARPDLLESLARASSQAAVAQMRALELANTVGQLAAGEKIACCFLKGVALDGLGVLPAGSRSVGDVDVLVSPDDAPALSRALEAQGFAASGEAYDHQLPALRHPELGFVEIHRHLPGVAVPGRRRFITLEEIREEGLERTWPRAGATSFLIEPTGMAAHLLAHGIAQHGFHARGYSPFRLVSDLLDLATDMALDDLITRAELYLARTLTRQEVDAALNVCRELGAGLLGLLDDDTPPALLLRHMVASALDPAYQRSLKLQGLAYPLAEGSRATASLGSLRHALFLSRSQVDAIYGPQQSAWGYAAKQLLRPFDLVRRALRR